MKKIFRLPVITLAIAASVIACKGNKSGNDSDSSKTDSSKSDSAGSMTGGGKADTAAKSDSGKKTSDSVVKADDTSKVKLDTVSKSVKETKTVKKVIVKNRK